MHTPPPPGTLATRSYASGLGVRGAFALALALGLTVAWAPLVPLLEHILYEDFFYYLRLGDQCVRGNGLTLDGTAKTNGFTPLWMVASIGFEWLADGLAAVRTMLSFAAVMHVAQGWLLLRLLQRLGVGHAAAVFAMLFFLFSYRAIAWNLCGMDPPLHGFFLLLSIDRLVAWRQSQHARELLLLGLCLGVNAWARIDGLLFGAFATLGTMLSRTGWREQLRAAALVGTAMLVCLLPWFVWSQLQSGVLLPNCHAAIDIWNAPPYASDKSLVENGRLLLAQLERSSWGLSEALTIMGLWPLVFPGPSVPGGIACVLAVLAIGGWLWHRRHPRFAVLALLYAYAVSHASYYVVFAMAEPRYLMPGLLVLLVVVTALADALVTRAPRWRRWVLATGLCLYAITVHAGVDAWRNHHGISLWHVHHRGLYDAAMWLRANTPADAIIGGWNCGIVSYHSERTVVNLDGVVNDDALEPLRRRELGRYIDQRQIGWLVDNWNEVEKYMDGYSGQPDWRLHWRLVFSSGSTVIGQRIE